MTDDVCCVYCDQPAVGERIYGLTDQGEEIVELVCDTCASL
jgi:hypothetical protein